MDSRSQEAHVTSTAVQTTPEVSPEKYDLVIIGSGTGAKLSAWTLGKLGWRIAVIERQYIGGACNNIACLPSKNLIYTAQISSYAHRLKEFGMEATNLTVNMSGVRERKRQMVNGEIEGDSNLFRLTGGELILGVGRMVGPKLVEVITNDGKKRLLEGTQILIGTGSRAVIDETPGLRESNPLTHIEALELGIIPDHLVILGAGYVGLEFAQAMRRLGSRVTLIDRGERILKQEDPDVSEAVLDLLRYEGIELLLEATVAYVSGESGKQVSLTIDQSGRQVTLNATHILVTTKRIPNTDGLGLDSAGVETNAEGYIRVNEHLQTTASGVWAVGDVAGTPKFTHAAFHDFQVFTDNVSGGHKSTEGRLIPFCLFLDPELARVGLNETEAKARGIKYRLFKLPIGVVLRARATMEKRGFMKALVAPDSGKIIGFLSFGANAGEVMAAVQMAMIAGLPYIALTDAILTHPTMAEGLKFLFLSQLTGSEIT
ncbi:dihydrolipoyl dehydrogenase family protein [Tunturiibacter gelidoferens]|uniref:Pyruvate/2-oxoglutarate dehydrogenase complex dihydrolipoamide dehydrogenase (E3) component n=1 Tax=Tunturiibacter gelidiferens TaxID=3069689 RepID=A0A9X0QHE5_9BACT|nr:FAD-dependent oxidoreductase [Edaphobacter lichenicola]MBB5330395.1 pyruvate/2-oxoglutarate dehydrogenase complex dihydrolipoamide dehydrogenase (E3) component [Edaphobacter lichenicola]